MEIMGNMKSIEIMEIMYSMEIMDGYGIYNKNIRIDSEWIPLEILYKAKEIPFNIYGESLR